MAIDQSSSSWGSRHSRKSTVNGHPNIALCSRHPRKRKQESVGLSSVVVAPSNTATERGGLSVGPTRGSGLDTQIVIAVGY